MANLEPAIKLLKNLASEVSPTALNKAGQNIVSDKSNGISLSDIQIPFMTSDENVIRVIDEFKLRDPENMIRFIVEGYFAQLECISESFGELKELDMINSLSFIGSAKREYKRAISNPNDKKEILREAMGKLDQGIEQLGQKAILYINKVREVDNRPKLSFFLKSKMSLNTVDTANHCAKTAVDSIIEAVNLQIAIGSECNWNVQSDIAAFYDFKTKVLNGSNCSLMHDYDDKCEEEFWLKLPNRLENAIDTANLLIDFKESTESDDFNYDNIDFC